MPLPFGTELSDGRLLLRAWRPGDAPALYEAVRTSADSLGRWLPWCRPGYDLPQAASWIDHCREGWAADEHFAFGVFERDTGALLGSVGLNHRNRLHRSAAMGYWVRHSHQCQGIASQAAALAARFGFEALDLVRIEIVVEPDNHASRRTAERTGARFEAIARHRLWIVDHAADAAVYVLIPSDLAPAPRPGAMPG